MNGKHQARYWGIILSLIVLGIAGFTWANYRFASQDFISRDFYPAWLGTRLFLTRGWSPYSQDTTQAIQAETGDQPTAGKSQALFVYPFYSVFVFGPFAALSDFQIARMLWMSALEISLLLLAGFSLALSRWRLPSVLLFLVVLFSVLWYYSVRPVINGDISVLVAFLAAAALLALRSGNDTLAGVLFAFSTLKPQMVVLLIGFAMLWTLSQRRWGLTAGFFSTLALLVAATSLLVPDWLLRNAQQLFLYRKVATFSTPGALFMRSLPGVGSQMGWALAGIASILLVWEWWLALRQRDFRRFYWTACLTLVLTPLTGIPTSVDNLVLLLPALVLVFASWEERWAHAGRWLVLVLLFLFLTGFWWYFVAQPQTFQIEAPFFFFVLPLTLLASLYWVRWWAINPPRLPLERLVQQVH